MKISIVTINYNDGNKLESTIKSVVNQTFFDNIEYIVIDGGSTDNSISIINKYKDKLKYYCSEKDNGRYNAMNKGIIQSSGDYVLFLNSGDYFYKDDVIEKSIEQLDCDFVYGNLEIRTNSIKYIKKYDKKIDCKYFIKESLPHPSCFIKRELFNDNLYDENFEIISDWLFFFKQIIFKKSSFKYIDITIGSFCTDGISSKNKMLLIKEKENSYKKLALLLQDKVYVSLTTWEKRYEFVADTIKTILTQKIRPNKIFLVLSKDELGDMEMPNNLKEIKDEIFEIVWIDANIKTMKKVLPILHKLNEDDIIINLDDDVILKEDFIESRLIDFIKKGMEYSISSQPDFKFCETYFSGCGSLMLRKYLNGYLQFINKEVIETYEDDWVYSFLHLLNGGKFELCSKYRVKDLDFDHQDTSSKSLGLYNTLKTSKVMQNRVIDLFTLPIRELLKIGYTIKWDIK